MLARDDPQPDHRDMPSTQSRRCGCARSVSCCVDSATWFGMLRRCCEVVTCRDISGTYAKVPQDRGHVNQEPTRRLIDSCLRSAIRRLWLCHRRVITTQG